MVTKVTTKSGRLIEVSTVLLAKVFRTRGSFIFETCLFFDNGDSKVVGSYQTGTEAIAGHKKEVKKAERRK